MGAFCTGGAPPPARFFPAHFLFTASMTTALILPEALLRFSYMTLCTFLHSRTRQRRLRMPAWALPRFARLVVRLVGTLLPLARPPLVLSPPHDVSGI